MSSGAIARAAPAPPDPQRVGGIALSFLPSESDPTARALAFARIRRVGITVARIDANWAEIERQPGVYDWSSLDAQVNELISRGLQPLIILDYGNPAYSPAGAAAQSAGSAGIPPFGIGSPQYYPPDSPPPFARFSAALAARYRGHVSRLEVWNEENLGWRFWEPHENPAAYAALLRSTYVAIKAVAPEDQVAFGGTFYPAIDTAAAAADNVPLPSGSAAGELALPHQGTLDFVSHALQAMPDLGAFFDAMAYHPYHFPYMAPEVNIPVEGTTETSMRALRGLLDQQGLTSKPIWITEVGWPNNTAAYGPSATKSASYLVRTFVTAWSHGINTIVWYCYGDGSDSQLNQESAFGIIDSSGQPKPAYYAWRALHDLLWDEPYLGPTRLAGLPADGRALRFGNATRQVTVVWLAPETMYSDQGPLPAATQQVMLRTPPHTSAIVDMTGGQLRVAASFEASPYPVYLVSTRARARHRRRQRRPRLHRRQPSGTVRLTFTG